MCIARHETIYEDTTPYLHQSASHTHTHTHTIYTYSPKNFLHLHGGLERPRNAPGCSLCNVWPILKISWKSIHMFCSMLLTVINLHQKIEIKLCMLGLCRTPPDILCCFWCHTNIERHTAHTIVSWPNPKQWVIVHTSDLMMIIRQSKYIFSQSSQRKLVNWKHTAPHIV